MPKCAFEFYQVPYENLQMNRFTFWMSPVPRTKMFRACCKKTWNLKLLNCYEFIRLNLARLAHTPINSESNPLYINSEWIFRMFDYIFLAPILNRAWFKKYIGWLFVSTSKTQVTESYPQFLSYKYKIPLVINVPNRKYFSYPFDDAFVVATSVVSNTVSFLVILEAVL